jgi:signal transduction histidine kinase/PAS domain-containing protein
MSDHDLPFRAGRTSLLQLLGILSASAFITEVLAFLLLQILPPLPQPLGMLLHASIPALLILPLFYWIALRPLLSLIVERRVSEQTLRQTQRELERNVQERTEKLLAINQALQEEIGERVRAEVALDDERRRLFSLLNELPALVYLKAPDYSIRFANRQFRARFGEPEAGLCYELVHSRSTPCERCTTASVLLEGQPVESDRTFADGTVYQLYDYPFVDVDGTELVLQLGIDVSERKRAEAELERANREALAMSQAEHRERLFAQGLAQAALALNASLDLDEVLDRILEQTQRVIPYQAAAVMLCERERVHLVRHRGVAVSLQVLEALESGVPLARYPMLEATCVDRRTVLIGDVAASDRWREIAGFEWARSFGAVAMVVGEEAIGLIALFSEQPGFFAQESIDRLQVFATHAVVAIQNARLYRAEQAARRTAELFSAASRALTKTLELDAVCNSLLDHLAYLIPYDRACVYLLDDDARLIPQAERGYREEMQGGHTHPMSVEAHERSHLHPLLTTGVSVLIRDTSQHPRWAAASGAGGAGSYLAVPLAVDGRTIGICELGKRQGDAYGEHEVQWAEGLVSQASVAVQNAWLFGQVQEGRERLQSLSRRLVEAQESERRFIARELHDEVGQALTSIMVGLKLLERQADRSGAFLAETAELKRTVEEMMGNLHRLAADLRPASLDHLGLIPALRQYCEMVRDKHGLQVQLETLGLQVRLPTEVETAMYRILQEALTNVIRHAQATRVDVILEQRGDRLIAIVEDDGVGFEPASAAQGGRLGLFGMRERAQALGGTLSIESAQRGGTTVYIEVPYDDKDLDRG